MWKVISLCLLSLVLSFFFYTGSVANTGETYLLAMGVNTEELKYADSDAKRFVEVMHKKFDIDKDNLYLLTNTEVNKYNFDQKIRQLAKDVTDKDTVYIYFSGHGKQRKDNNEDETDCQEEFLAFSDQDLRDDYFVTQINSIKTENIYTIIDACFSAGALRGLCPGSTKKIMTMTTETEGCKDKVKKDTIAKRLKGIVYASAKEDQLAWEDANKGGGVFTSIFLLQIKKHKTLDDAFKATVPEMKKLEFDFEGCRQEPQRTPPLKEL